MMLSVRLVLPFELLTVYTRHMKKLKLGVIFGGRSGEHEVSIVSARSVIAALNKSKYEIIPIGIAKDGMWICGDDALQLLADGKYKDMQCAHVSADPTDKNSFLQQFDVIFPVLHGPYGEDGTIQGLFEMANVPYVGCGVLASSVGMDKLMTKSVWEQAGLPVVPYLGINRSAWEKERETVLERIEKEIGYPCFVKPSNLGSSVGITKVKMPEYLPDALETAAMYDRRILVEKGLNVREMECAVLGNDEPIVSPFGELSIAGEFYDFYEKYVNNRTEIKIPADIDEKTQKKMQDFALRAFKVLDGSGLARVDMFLDRDTNAIYLNEINTMPGFTSISMYPKLMEASGTPYEELLDKLIQFALARHSEKLRNRVTFESRTDWYKGK